MSIREKTMAMVLGPWVMLLGCMVVFLPAGCHAEGESGAAVSLTPPGQEVQIPIQSKKSFKFQIPNIAQKANIVLKLDARIQKPGLVGGLNFPAAITLNGKPILSPRLVNKPLFFQTANGYVRQWYKGGVKTEWGSTTAWLLYYAENFKIIDSEANPHRPIGVSGPHYAFDISDIAEEQNTLTIENLLDERVQGLINSQVPIVVANVAVDFPAKIEKPEQGKYFTPFSYDMPDYVTPKKEWKVDYEFNIDARGGIEITIGDKAFPINTCFSYPHGGWNSFSSEDSPTKESNWDVNVTPLAKGHRIEGEGDFYKIVRVIDFKDDRIDVSDTITNKSATEDIGIIIKNQIDLANIEVDHLFWGGKEVFLKNGSGRSRQNPTLYLQSSGAGIGLVAVDDVYRVHHKTFREGNVGGIKDEQFALPPAGEYTMEWSIYPTGESNYFTFINAIRRDWQLNSLLVEGISVSIGPWVFADDDIPSFSDSKSERGRGRFALKPECSSVRLALPRVDSADGKISYMHYGYPMLHLSEEAVEGYKNWIKETKEALGPQKDVHGYYGPPTFCTGEKSKSLFKESRIINSDGSHAAWQGLFPLYFPTKTNAFGQMVTELIDQWLDWGADGIYFDFFEPSLCGVEYTYNTWDGHTAAIDPKTKTIKRKFASIDLLSCEFLADLVRYLDKKGKSIVANRGSTTKTMTEAAREIVPRLGEAGRLSSLLNVHLTPCPAGYQATGLDDVHTEVLAALDYGLLSYCWENWYDFEENPLVRMYPIKVKELHQGYVIGENKIVTKRSGTYGFGDKSKITCFLYDKEGHAIPNDFPVVSKGDKSFIKVDLSPGQLAILKREL